jgi:hypothetical protein
MGEALRPGRDTSEQCTDDHLSRAGHRTVAAMEAPNGSYQEQAARSLRELGLDLVNAGKSNQDAAVEYSEQAECRGASPWPDCWDQFVDQERANHHRKVGFIREFEKVVRK